MVRSILQAVLVLLGLLVADFVFRLEDTGGEERERRAYESQVFELDPELVPGVSARSRVVSTPQGLRGDLLDRDAFNVLLLGSSTTYCQFLDESDALTTRIAEALPPPVRAALDVRVATCARGGLLASHNLQELRGLLRDPDTSPDVVIALLGGKDMTRFYKEAPWPAGGGPAGAHADPNGPYVGERRDALLSGWYQPGERGMFLPRLQAVYREHAKLDTLTPELEVVFETYVSSFATAIERIRELCERRGITLVLATQPLNYAGVEVDERTGTYALAFPGSGGGFVPAPGLLHAMMTRYNDVLREFGRHYELGVIDLAKELDGQADCYYDQWHYTVEGARRAGELIARALIDQGVLVQ